MQNKGKQKQAADEEEEEDNSDFGQMSVDGSEAGSAAPRGKTKSKTAAKPAARGKKKELVSAAAYVAYHGLSGPFAVQLRRRRGIRLSTFEEARSEEGNDNDLPCESSTCSKQESTSEGVAISACICACSVGSCSSVKEQQEVSEGR